MSGHEGKALTDELIDEVFERQGDKITFMPPELIGERPVVILEEELYITGGGPDGLHVGQKLGFDLETGEYEFREVDGTAYVTTDELGGMLKVYAWVKKHGGIVLKIGSRLYRFPWIQDLDEGEQVAVEALPTSLAGLAERLTGTEEQAERLYQVLEVEEALSCPLIDSDPSYLKKA